MQSTRGHPARTHLSQSRGSGEPAPTTPPRDLPHVEVARNSTPSGEQRTVHGRQEAADRHRDHERRSSGRSEQGIQRQVHPPGRHPCKPASAGAPAGRQCWTRWISCLHLRCAQASTLVRDMCPSTNGGTKLATLAVGSFGRLGVEGSNFIDKAAASVVGGRDGGSMARKGVVKERLPQIIPAITQAAISRRMPRLKLQLRDRQEARRSKR